MAGLSLLLATLLLHLSTLTTALPFPTSPDPGHGPGSPANMWSDFPSHLLSSSRAVKAVEKRLELTEKRASEAFLSAVTMAGASIAAETESTNVQASDTALTDRGSATAAAASAETPAATESKEAANKQDMIQIGIIIIAGKESDEKQNVNQEGAKFPKESESSRTEYQNGDEKYEKSANGGELIKGILAFLLYCSALRASLD
ncbi:MAG: hypothetical protein Q9201_006565 [Fulgogasparrea decipioides]